MTITIAPFNRTSLSVVFEPTASGDRTGTISFTSNSPNSPHVINLVGKGVPAGVVNPPANTTLSYLTASGSKLVDANNNEVMLRSINWYGFEQIGVPGGAWTRPFRTKTIGGVVHEGMLDEIKRLGFNSIRLLFSVDSTWAGYMPNTTSGWSATYINPEKNNEFLNAPPAGHGYWEYQNPQDVKSTVEIMDIFVGWCEELGIRIIWDLHCLSPDFDNVLGTGGKWYSTANPGDTGGSIMDTGKATQPLRSARSEAQAIAAHVFLANRYKNRPVVCGFDLINEPHNCTWDRDPSTGVVGFYERCGNAIHAVNPNVLIICEGATNGDWVDHTPVGHKTDQASLEGKYQWGTVWSGKLDTARTTQVTLGVPNKVVYSPHEYGSWPGNPAAHQWFYPDVFVGSGYAGLPFPDNMFDVWRRQWGYLAEENIAPVWIGEFGSYLRVGGDPLNPNSDTYVQRHYDFDVAWLSKLADYCNTYKIGFSYWAWNPGGDPDGLLEQQPAGTWQSAQTFKLAILEPFLSGVVSVPESAILSSDGQPLLDENGQFIEI